MCACADLSSVWTVPPISKLSAVRVFQLICSSIDQCWSSLLIVDRICHAQKCCLCLVWSRQWCVHNATTTRCVTRVGFSFLKETWPKLVILFFGYFQLLFSFILCSGQLIFLSIPLTSFSFLLQKQISDLDFYRKSNFQKYIRFNII